MAPWSASNGIDAVEPELDEWDMQNVNTTQVLPTHTPRSTVYQRRELSDNVRPCWCKWLLGAASSLNDARGGESERLRWLPPLKPPEWPSEVHALLTAKPPNRGAAGEGSADAKRADCGRGATTLVSVRPLPTCRSVNGFAVAAACLLYSLYRL